MAALERLRAVDIARLVHLKEHVFTGREVRFLGVEDGKAPCPSQAQPRSNCRPPIVFGDDSNERCNDARQD